MMPVFFYWNASTNPDDVRSVGVGTVAKVWKAHPLTNGVLGVLYVENAQGRIVADGLSPNLLTLPGPNGAFTAKHVKHIQKEFPSVKAGDPFRATLSAVYAALNDEHFNPDNF